MTDFMRGLVNGFLLVLKVLVDSQQSFEAAMEVLFQVLVQQDSSSKETPNKADEIASLRIGFGACLGLIKAWAKTLADLEEGKTLVVNNGSPNDSKMFNQFLQRAFQTTAHARFCITSQGYVGLVPDRTEVGDLVAVFHGSPQHFVLRSIGQEERRDNDEITTYRLVGSGFLRRLAEGGSVTHEPEKDQDIRLV